MSDISFFVPKGPYNINELSKDFSSQKINISITDGKTLDKAGKSHITFFNSLASVIRFTSSSMLVTTQA